MKIKLLMVIGLGVLMLSGCQQVNDMVNGNKAATNTAANSNALANADVNSNANANSSDANKSAGNSSVTNKEPENSESEDIIAQRKTMEDVRNIGTAMFSWLTDVAGNNIYPNGIRPPSSKNSVIRTSLDVHSRDNPNFHKQQSKIERLNYIQIQSATPTVSVDIKKYVRISYEDLKKQLVLTREGINPYLTELPEKDGWGNPYEFYLNTENPHADKIMAIRSPGRDGKFQDSSVYQEGKFSPDSFDEDIVWADGVFVRWVERQPQS